MKFCVVLVLKMSFSSGPSAVRENLIADKEIAIRVHLQAPYTNTHLTPVMAMYNKEMSEKRVAVDWLFGNIDFKKQIH